MRQKEVAMTGKNMIFGLEDCHRQVKSKMLILHCALHYRHLARGHAAGFAAAGIPAGEKRDTDLLSSSFSGQPCQPPAVLDHAH
jgi:hypothetical protein